MVWYRPLGPVLGRVERQPLLTLALIFGVRLGS
jgi:hypothetical protein